MLTDNIILLQIGDFCILHICHTYTGFFPPCYISHCSCYICVKRVADVADGFWSYLQHQSFGIQVIMRLVADVAEEKGKASDPMIWWRLRGNIYRVGGLLRQRIGVLYELHHLQGVVKLDAVVFNVLFKCFLVGGIELEQLLHA